MFSKILVANRGEIACRIIKTCRRLGVKTVAIYSVAEGNPLHAELADEAVVLPDAANPISAYLDIDTVVGIARQIGAEAVHPGYGLLSENADFAQACADAGITFIGPTPDVIRLMANKREARRKLAEFGVSVLPGTSVALDGAADLETQADSIGYPVMVKASEGGGGIGMQLVTDSKRLDRSVKRARSSSRRSFGSEDVYLERFISDARHVEVQVISDADGNATHLWERECSVQRRHQKVIEEAPSPSISDEARASLIAAATHAAQSVGYTNVGTFEFVVDQQDNFYFLETNTRLQVEHTTTEMTTGVDIVEQQLRIAAGLPMTIHTVSVARDVRPQPFGGLDPISVDPSDGVPPAYGHAIQCRIYAEDPDTFIPSPGSLTEFHIPKLVNLRIDTGFRAGDEVSSFFDPLLAKVIAWGETRDMAVALMSNTLSETRITGVKTNIPTLQKALDHPDFVTGRYTTDLLERLG